MMTFLAVTRVPSKPAAFAGAAVLAVLAAGAIVLQGQTTTYTIYSPEGRRAFVLRAGTPETFALEQLSGVFGLTFTEDRLANGLVIGTRKDRIVAVPGQSFIQVGGRVVGLEGPIRRERNSWMAPVDFLTKALAPAIGEPVVIRRTSRLILIGNVRVPQVSGRIERTTVGARVVLSIQPSTPHRVTREGNRLFLRFDAAALDATAISGTAPEFVGPSRVDGSAMVIELGPAAATFRAEEDRSRESLTIELLPAAPVASLPPPTAGGRPLAPPPPPQFELMPGLRTIVLDPGHGGDDEGTHSASGVEKDVALQFARRLKAAIEGRFGLRVLLTRDADENVPVDRRTAFANHNNADLFLSLHANSSVRSTARGVQVWSLDAGDYAPPTPAAEAKRKTVPLLGGGTRIIDPMPWDLAQLPFAEQSATFGSVLIRQFTERAVPLHHRPVVVAPVRVLAGANMPALLIELGFLSNADDEKLLANAESQGALVESILAAIAEFRRGFPAPEGGRRP